MNLDTFYDTLVAVPPETVVIVASGTHAGQSISEPHSWRGDYEQISFEPVTAKVTTAEILKQLDEIYGTLLTGYKGGEYYVGGDEELYVAHDGSANTDCIMETELVGEVLMVKLWPVED